MPNRAGERIEQGGSFTCDKCHQSVQVGRGESLPVCPSCGNQTFSREGEPR
jgi:predicted RNA-binding Zn-ribbon protein involved in translation (DUF1610 family)